MSEEAQSTHAHMARFERLLPDWHGEGHIDPHVGGTVAQIGVRQQWQTQRGGAGAWESVNFLTIDAGAVLNSSDDTYQSTDLTNPLRIAQSALPSFYGWRREIARRDRAAPRSAVRSPTVQARGKSDFVRLDVRPSAATASPLIEIVLPGGARVLVPTGVTREQLREVLAAFNEVSDEGPRSC